MTTETNKTLVRQMIDIVWNSGDPQAIDRFFAPDFLNHSPVPGSPPDRAGLQQSARALQAGFPDLQVAIEDLIAEGEKVAARMTMRGTHLGAIVGIPPTGKSITMTAMSILRIQHDRIVERWSIDTSEDMLRQIQG